MNSFKCEKYQVSMFNFEKMENWKDCDVCLLLHCCSDLCFKKTNNLQAKLLVLIR